MFIGEIEKKKPPNVEKCPAPRPPFKPFILLDVCLCQEKVHLFSFLRQSATLAGLIVFQQATVCCNRTIHVEMVAILVELSSHMFSHLALTL